ncbi:DUF2490 domain-containing protein [Croceivirga thetidis]|nr:DUF2490 domain-containing protein [Croceivirga thetidis]
MLFTLYFFSIKAQDNFIGLWQQTAAVNYKVSPFYLHNFALNSRNYLYRDNNLELSARHLDFIHFSNLRVSEGQSIAVGLQYRHREPFDGGSNELRFTQQYNINTRPNVVRYGHRVRAQQRIRSSRTVHRFRYRFSTDFPLKGEKLDVGEPYLVTNVEKLLSVARQKKPQYDIRFTVNLGWKLNDRYKFQFGVEHRLEDLAQYERHELFLMSRLNLSL